MRAIPLAQWGAPLAFAVAVLAFSWTGYIASDDASYATAGLGWLNDFPYVGQDHWSLRHTLVVPIGISFRFFGVSEFALVLPAVLYFLSLLMLVHSILRRYFDWQTASLSVFLLATVPLLAVQATIPMPDIAEVFFCVASLAFFLKGCQSADPRWPAVLAGVAAAFAWMTRETAVFFIVTYAVLFLLGYGFPRRVYFFMAAGFLFVAGLEMLYFAVVAGNPLHRIVTDLRSHLKVDALADLGGVASRVADVAAGVEAGKQDGFARTGNLSVSRALNPVVAALANQEFMLLYYFAVPAAVWLVFGRGGDDGQRRLIRVLALAAFLWLGFLWLQLGMSLLPRYYMLPTVLLCALLAVWIRVSVFPHSRGAAAAITGALMLTNLAGIYLDNRNPIFGERTLARLAATAGEPVFSDTETARRAEFLLTVAGVSNRVVGGDPAPGALFVYNPKHYVRLGQEAQGIRPRLSVTPTGELRNDGNWTQIAQREDERRYPGIVLEALNLRSRIPDGIYRRLDRPNPTVVVYRVPAVAAPGPVSRTSGLDRK